jgi:hypothetical protein
MLPIIDIDTASKIAIISKIHYSEATRPEQSGQRNSGFFIYRRVLMAQKRMFNKSITNSSRFLMMPIGTQALYFHLGMNADDDGFCEHFTIMRMTESKPDDLKILQAKGFVHVFDERVLVIRDWHENNYLRSDRYNQSKYLEMYKSEIESLNECLPVGVPDVNQWDTQIRLDKIRLDKNSISIKKRPKDINEITNYFVHLGLDNIIAKVQAEEYFNHFEMVGWVYGKGHQPIKDWKRACVTWKTNMEKNKEKNTRPFAQRNNFLDSLPEEEKNKLIDSMKTKRIE